MKLESLSWSFPLLRGGLRSRCPFVAGGGVEVAEDHLLGCFVAGEGLGGGVDIEGDGVADADVGEGLDGGDEVAGFAGAEGLDFGLLGGVFAELGDEEGAVEAHHADLVADFEAAVEDTDVGDDAAVVVVDGVEDECAGVVGEAGSGRGKVLQMAERSAGMPSPVLAETGMQSSAGRPRTCSTSMAISSGRAPGGRSC